MDYPLRTGEFRTPGGHPVTMHYRDNTNDWNTLTATLTQDEYNLPQGMPGHAVDVGGYLGSVGIALALDNPDLRVTIIEPVPPNCELIRQNIPDSVKDRVTLIEGAVGKEGRRVGVSWGFTGSEALAHHAFVGNSTLADKGSATGVQAFHPITLGGLLLAVGQITFLKIDCEGAEWDFLNVEDAALSRVYRIAGEAHAVDGHKGRDILALLNPTHTVSLSGDSDGTCGFAAVRR